MNPAALALARELRRAGLKVELGEGAFRLKKSFEAADKAARRIVILGEDEERSGILTVKDFSTGVQTKVPRAELAAYLLSRGQRQWSDSLNRSRTRPLVKGRQRASARTSGIQQSSTWGIQPLWDRQTK